MTRFFIDHPVAATVVSVVIVVLGVVALFVLPVAQYPEITPPTIEVTANYPGANVRDVGTQVASPLEKEINGVERLLYMESKSTNDGQMKLTITFEVGTNLDMAQVLVQNRVGQALAKLPATVQQLGVITKKKSPSIILCVNLISPDGRYPQLFLSNYATLNIKDDLVGLPGVGDVTFLGEREYSMRIWLDPERVAHRDLTAGDIVQAIKQQNTQVAAGQVGQPPVPRGQNFQLPLTTRGRLEKAAEFENILIKTDKDGITTRLRDVGRAELGAKSSDVGSTLDGQPTVTLAVYQLPGSNALKTADNIRAKMEELKLALPGMEYQIVYDTTPFIDQSIHEVFKTLVEAVILVAIVVLFFLQDWKAMILPMIDVPVSLIGTLAVMALLGFSLNNLTLFGLVLAIGIVVDDAIVVLENIEHWMAKGLDARSATIKAMQEVTGPIIAITLVLIAVFIPTAFITGITGQFFRQFALTITASMVISAVNAMTMTPSRAVQIFKHGHGVKEALPWWGVALLGGFLTAEVGQALLVGLGVEKLSPGADWAVWGAMLLPGAAAGWWLSGPLNRGLSVVFTGFNRLFDRFTHAYGQTIGRTLRLSGIVLLVYGGLLGLTYLGFVRVPTGFIPSQDKGYLIVGIQLPDAAAVERTERVVQQVNRMILGDKKHGGKYRGPAPKPGALTYPPIAGVQHTVAFQGLSVLTNTNQPNQGSMFVVLEPFEKRKHGPDANQVLAEVRKRFATVQEALIVAYGAPPVDGLGTAGGFKLQVRDVGAAGLTTLERSAAALAQQGNASPALVGVTSAFRANSPQLFVKVDEAKAMALRVPIGKINEALQIYLGSLYVNDVTLFGQNFQVNVQADAQARLRPEDIRRIKVRNLDGEMVPLGTLIEVTRSNGPATVTRYNTKPAAALTGATRPGVSSGQAIAVMDRSAAQVLPRSLDFQWTELTLLQIQAGNTAMIAFALAVLLVFLVLAFQYESWTLPLAVILVVPMCILSAIAGVALTGGDINIFTQIGLVVLIGLASKNAILIVEFAKVKQDEGLPPDQAAVEASRLRLRPIVMTSFAFILGVVPLVLSHGAGAEMRSTLGIAVFSGMLGVTLFGLLLTPVFFYVIQWYVGPKKGAPPPSRLDIVVEASGQGPDGAKATLPAGTDGPATPAPT